MAPDVRYFPVPGTLPLTEDLVGVRANFHYGSGNVLQQFYRDAETMVWSGIEGDFAGVRQTEPTMRVFELGAAQYFITWYEEGTVATAAHGEVFDGGYPIAVVADFGRLVATAAYTNPREDGGQYFLVDQATIRIVDAPAAFAAKIAGASTRTG
ncbi:MoaF C-terminal domain-containing protein [Amycolatopsis minnesotensis]|uniref:MoaF C-terminal domain-containing protein n=1 Tax=Amycolatopsis minnesotensis TaxID=337894 RepID=A0ABP5BQC9_9PSEU